MIYKFAVFSEEVDGFLREIHINSDATFLELHDAILASVDYKNDQMTSFFMCDDDWDKEEEITQEQMGTASDEDNYVMAETQLDAFINDEGQKLMFVYDYMNERAFFLELKSIQTGKSLDKAVCAKSKGKAPKQMVEGMFLDDDALAKKNIGNELDLDDDFNDMGGFNDDELGDLSINDNYFEDQQQ